MILGVSISPFLFCFFHVELSRRPFSSRLAYVTRFFDIMFHSTTSSPSFHGASDFVQQELRIANREKRELLRKVENSEREAKNAKRELQRFKKDKEEIEAEFIELCSSHDISGVTNSAANVEVLVKMTAERDVITSAFNKVIVDKDSADAEVNGLQKSLSEMKSELKSVQECIKDLREAQSHTKNRLSTGSTAYAKSLRDGRRMRGIFENATGLFEKGLRLAQNQVEHLSDYESILVEVGFLSPDQPISDDDLLEDSIKANSDSDRGSSRGIKSELDTPPVSHALGMPGARSTRTIGDFKDSPFSKASSIWSPRGLQGTRRAEPKLRGRTTSQAGKRRSWATASDGSLPPLPDSLASLNRPIFGEAKPTTMAEGKVSDDEDYALQLKLGESHNFFSGTNNPHLPSGEFSRPRRARVGLPPLTLPWSDLPPEETGLRSLYDESKTRDSSSGEEDIGSGSEDDREPQVGDDGEVHQLEEKVKGREIMPETSDAAAKNEAKTPPPYSAALRSTRKPRTFEEALAGPTPEEKAVLARVIQSSGNGIFGSTTTRSKVPESVDEDSDKEEMNRIREEQIAAAQLQIAAAEKAKAVTKHEKAAATPKPAPSMTPTKARSKDSPGTQQVPAVVQKPAASDKYSEVTSKEPSAAPVVTEEKPPKKVLKPTEKKPAVHTTAAQIPPPEAQNPAEGTSAKEKQGAANTTAPQVAPEAQKPAEGSSATQPTESKETQAASSDRARLSPDANTSKKNKKKGRQMPVDWETRDVAHRQMISGLLVS